MRSRLAPLGALLLVGPLLLAGCGSDGSGDSDATDAGGSGVSCDYVQSTVASAKEVDPPPSTATLTGDVHVTISTDDGDIGLELDADAAPCTVNSFVSLAKQGFYDDVPCHRITASPGFEVLQCGDPSGTGGGGPGYTYADELTGDEQYTAGTVAMANAGPDTNGSQFFLVYGDTQLDQPAYTVFGHMEDAGVQVVKRIGARGVAGGGTDGPPAEPVTMTSVSVDD